MVLIMQLIFRATVNEKEGEGNWGTINQDGSWTAGLTPASQASLSLM